MAANESFDRRLFDRRMFLWAAIGFSVLVLAGFAQTYYLKPILGAAPLRTLTHIHGLVMSAWVMLFAAQVYLIRSRNVKLHMTVGFAGIGLAVAVIIVGIATALFAAKYGTPSAPPDIPPLVFLVVPMIDMVAFAIFFGAAIYYRKNAANHKRLILLTAFNFLPPAIARIPVASLQALGPLWFFGFPDLLLLIAVAVDTWRNGKLNKAFALGAAFLIASHPLRIMLGGTEAWQRFAEWAVSFV